ncbi:N-acetylglucosamine kinase [Brevibacterium casei]|uniref:N-acetylglucosamine kinase n=1 Tax=Brevibacterium casei TaxID=33889 RepID=UPI0011A8DD69|nr:BadF/BadG/BcrA/BcrD ATPase family protein [Brevibacterium casei]
MRDCQAAELVLGIDVGGTGSRVALAAAADRDADPAASPESADDPAAHPAVADTTRSDRLGEHTVLGTLTGPRVEIGPEGSSAPVVIRRLVSAARQAWPEQIPRVVGIGIGATGIASLTDDPAVLAQVIAAEADAPTAVTIDAVTAHLGALRGQGGAIAVLGTGAIAIAHPGADDHGVLTAQWSRVDGWGHLFGDRGGGAWLGRLALEAALRAHDKVDVRGAALLAAATGRFGQPSSWPATFYTRSDRAGLLAEFAADVATLARLDDPVAVDLLAEAGREAARSAVAASTAAGAQRVAVTGGLTQAGEALLEAFRAEAQHRRPDAAVVEAAGSPLDGALVLADHVAAGRVRAQAEVLWV